MFLEDLHELVFGLSLGEGGLCVDAIVGLGGEWQGEDGHVEMGLRSLLGEGRPHPRGRGNKETSPFDFGKDAFPAHERGQKERRIGREKLYLISTCTSWNPKHALPNPASLCSSHKHHLNQISSNPSSSSDPFTLCCVNCKNSSSAPAAPPFLRLPRRRASSPSLSSSSSTTTALAREFEGPGASCGV